MGTPGRIVAASKAEHGLQDQRRSCRRIDGGMGTGEHQRQALIGNVVVVGARQFFAMSFM